MTTVTSLNNMMAEISTILKQILNCERVNFLLRDEELIKIFTEENKGFGQNITVEKYIFLLVAPNSIFNKKSKILREDKISKASDPPKFHPCFENLEGGFYGKVTKKQICHSVYIPEKIKKQKKFDIESIYMIIQCDKLNSKTKFSMNHLYTLMFFNNLLSECIEKIKLEYKLQKREKI